MSKTTSALPPIVSREEWLEARKALLVREKALTRERDAVAAQRRRLPMVRVDKPYRFHGPSGPATLADMFDGCRQLIVYHFMFAPEWNAGCGSCTHLMDEIGPGHIDHLMRRDTAFVCVSRAPEEKLAAYRASRGWTFRWYSSLESEFNYDFHVTLDESVAPMEYNYRTPAEHERNGTGYYFSGEPPHELPGFSVFLREGNEVFHTYSTYGRGGETIGGAHYLLDLTVYGRQQDWEDSPAGWPQRPTYG